MPDLMPSNASIVTLATEALTGAITGNADFAFWIAATYYNSTNDSAGADVIYQKVLDGDFTLSDLFAAGQTKTLSEAQNATDLNGTPDPTLTVNGIDFKIGAALGGTEIDFWQTGTTPKNTTYHLREYFTDIGTIPSIETDYGQEPQNQAPVLTADAPSNGLTEAGESLAHEVIDGVATSTVQLYRSDPDSDATSYNLVGWTDAGGGIYTKDGAYGTASLDVNTNVITYTLRNDWGSTNDLADAQAASDTFTLSINDGELDSEPVDITFDITGTGDWFAVTAVISGPLTKTAVNQGNGADTAETFVFHLPVEGDHVGYEGTITIAVDGDFTGANENATVLVGGEIEDVYAGTGLLYLAGSAGGQGTEPADLSYVPAHLSGSADVIATGFDDGFVDLSVSLSGQVANNVSTLTVTLDYSYWA
jgi:VCBS repeat-containing protein